MSEPKAASTIELGPVQAPSGMAVFLAVAFVAAPLTLATIGVRRMHSLPDRTTLDCRREGQTITCAEMNRWDKRGPPRAEQAALHTGKPEQIEYIHISGRSAKDCVKFAASRVCGGEAMPNAAALRSLSPGKSLQLDATSAETTAEGVAFTVFTLLLTAIWIKVSTYAVGRRTRVRVAVHDSHLDLETLWGGFWVSDNGRVERGEEESVSVEPVGEASSPRGWSLVHRGPSGRRAILMCSDRQRPPDLDAAATRLRTVLGISPEPEERASKEQSQEA